MCGCVGVCGVCVCANSSISLHNILRHVVRDFPHLQVFQVHLSVQGTLDYQEGPMRIDMVDNDTTLYSHHS